MSADEEDGFYRGFSNASLWPLLHEDLAGFRYRRAWWHAYAAVNARFADAVAEAAAPGERVWVHDYHLMLLPEMLRRRRPDLAIGFFLHTPFPAAETFRRHPHRKRLLDGVLGADLVGFQTRGHARRFREAVRRLAGHRGDAGVIRHAGSTTSVGVFPVGINRAGFDRALDDPATAAWAERIASAHAGRWLVLGVERLDPTKGILQKLAAIDTFLREHPQRRGGVAFVLVAVPSRGHAPEYQRLREDVERAVGRINGEHADLDHDPVHLICRGVPLPELCALYRCADVCLVTPLADGMNLVAKEYLACQPEGGAGVLVLSEFAGAADELRGALRVNPHDTDGVADAVAEALDRPESSRREALAPMREHVRTHHAGPWAARFVEAMDAAASLRRNAGVRALTPVALAPLGPSAPGRKALFLDYDGTLRTLVDDPAAATPEPPLRLVLQALAERHGLDVFIVSGRDLAFLERHLGGHGFTLIGEHGFACSGPDGRPSLLHPGTDLGWMPAVAEAMERFARATPGTHVERKASAIVWHHRRAPRAVGSRTARQLVRYLRGLVGDRPLAVTRGRCIVEVTDRRIDKGLAVDHFLHAAEATGRPYAAILCIGDDRTDEAMFRGRRDDPAAITVRVGGEQTLARFRVPGVDDVLAALREIAGELVPTRDGNLAAV